MNRILFVSDIHYSPDETRIAKAFLRFLQQSGAECDHLYILGDLFNFWHGDEFVDRPGYRELVDKLRELTDNGVNVYFLAGNRDFLIGEGFLRSTGIRLLTDPFIAEHYGLKILLSHGDIFCGLDRGYQLWRRFTRQRWVQKLYLTIPPTTRLHIANWIQEKFRKTRPNIGADYRPKLDVVEADIDAYIEQHPVDLIIHGHTHRPAIHPHNPGEKTISRVVIGDWGNVNTVIALHPDRSITRSTFNLDQPRN